VHDYYYEWRAQHPDVDVWDGSPALVNFSTSRFTEVLEKRIWNDNNNNTLIIEVTFYPVRV